jgi:hypothetical protein
MRVRLLLLSVLVALPALAEDPPAAAPAAAPGAPAAPTVEDFVGRFEAAWKTRDDAASVKANEELITQGLKAFPEAYELLWRAARVRWWQADGTTDSKARVPIAKEGKAFAERAIKVKSDGFEAHYYTALTIGAYSQAVGILAAIGEGLEGQFNDHLDVALKRADTFDRSGPHNAKGRYWWELPWPKRNLGKSREELTKVSVAHPEHLRCWLYLAQTELKDGNPKVAKTAIDKVLAGGIDYDPPEGRRIKALAKAVSDEIDAALK